MVVPCAPSLLLLLSMAALSVLSCTGAPDADYQAAMGAAWAPSVSLAQAAEPGMALRRRQAGLPHLWEGSCLGPLCSQKPLSNRLKAAKVCQAVDPDGAYCHTHISGLAHKQHISACRWQQHHQDWVYVAL